jgi:hypothetical protein
LLPSLADDIKENRIIYGIPITIKYQFPIIAALSGYSRAGFLNTIYYYYSFSDEYADGSKGWRIVYGGYSIDVCLGFGLSYKIKDKLSIFIETNAGYTVNKVEIYYILNSKIGITVPLHFKR